MNVPVHSNWAKYIARWYNIMSMYMVRYLVSVYIMRGTSNMRRRKGRLSMNYFNHCYNRGYREAVARCQECGEPEITRFDQFCIMVGLVAVTPVLIALAPVVFTIRCVRRLV